MSAVPGVARAAGNGVQPRFRLMRPGAATTATMLLDPAVAVLTLVAATICFGTPFDRHYGILALLVFSITFPSDAGAQEHADTQGLVRAIGGRWVVTAAALWLLGWACDALTLFDANVIVAWAVATPAAQYVARRSWPAILPRLFTGAGVQRSVVIAGANETGRRLAAQIRANPCLGLRLAGFFDDRKSGGLAGFDPSQVLGSLSELADFVKRDRVDVIYSALPVSGQPRVLALLEELCDTTASIYFVPDIPHLNLIQAQLDTVGIALRRSGAW